MSMFSHNQEKESLKGGSSVKDKMEKLKALGRRASATFMAAVMGATTSMGFATSAFADTTAGESTSSSTTHTVSVMVLGQGGTTDYKFDIDKVKIKDGYYVNDNPEEWDGDGTEQWVTSKALSSNEILDKDSQYTGGSETDKKPSSPTNGKQTLQKVVEEQAELGYKLNWYIASDSKGTLKFTTDSSGNKIVDTSVNKEFTWYGTSEGGTKVTKDITVVGVFEKAVPVLTINYGINDVDDVNVEIPAGKTYYEVVGSVPNDPTRENYDFTGWTYYEYSTYDKTEKVNFDFKTTKVNRDITVYANWEMSGGSADTMSKIVYAPSYFEGTYSLLSFYFGSALPWGSTSRFYIRLNNVSSMKANSEDGGGSVDPKSEEYYEFTRQIVGRQLWGECIDHNANNPQSTGVWSGTYYGNLLNFNKDTGEASYRIVSLPYGARNSGSDSPYANQFGWYPGKTQRGQYYMTLSGPLYGYGQVIKSSKVDPITNGNCNYSFAGAEYAIYDSNDDKYVTTVTTDAEGKTPTVKLLAGSNGHTYYAVETKAPEGYDRCGDDYGHCDDSKDDGRHYFTVTKDNTEDKPATVKCKDNPKTDPLQLWKWDNETNSTKAEGANNLIVTYEIKFYAQDVDGELDTSQPVTRTWYVKTDKDGYAKLSAEYLDSAYTNSELYFDADGQATIPRGFITVRECKSNDAYALTDGSTKTVTVADHDSLMKNDLFKGITEDEPYRSDLSFTKKESENGKKLQDIPFLISLLDDDGNVVEEHVVLTDKNGIFDSTALRKTTNTNANDAYAVLVKDGKEYSLVEDENGDSEADKANIKYDDEDVTVKFKKKDGSGYTSNVSETDLTASCGLWFGEGTIDNERGSLCVGTYRVQELRCKGNEGRSLFNDTLYVTAQTTAGDAHMYAWGTIVDYKVQLTSYAYGINNADKDKTSKTIGLGVVKVGDDVDITHLTDGEKYTLKGRVVNAKGETVKYNGKEVTAEKTFTANADAEQEVTLEFDLDTSAMKDGDKLVVFECLYDSKGELVASEEEIGNHSQTVTVAQPEIETTAKDGVDGDKKIITDKETVLVDTVEYHNLITGRKYNVKGTIHVKNADGTDGGELKDANGNAITAESGEFTPKYADDTVDVTFKFDTRLLEDDTKLVVFEDLYLDGKSVTTHADIKDEGQTVTIKHPVVHTTAVDGVDGDKNVVTDKKMTIVDTVKYEDVIIGKTYKVSGQLMVKKENKVYNVTVDGAKFGDGKTVTSSEDGTIFKYYTDETDTDKYVSLTKNADGTWTLYTQVKKPETTTAGTKTSVATAVATATTAADTAAGKDADTDTKTTTDKDGNTIQILSADKVVVEDTGEVSVSEEVLKDKDGNIVTAETEFKAEKTEGTVDVTFTFDGSNLTGGTKLVAYEDLSEDGVVIATHADIKDEDQTVLVDSPEIGTTAVDKLDSDKYVIADEEATITDTVEYKNVVKDEKYTMAGILIDSETGLPLMTGEGVDKYDEDQLNEFLMDLTDALGFYKSYTAFINGEEFGKGYTVTTDTAGTELSYTDNAGTFHKLEQQLEGKSWVLSETTAEGKLTTTKLSKGEVELEWEILTEKLPADADLSEVQSVLDEYSEMTQYMVMATKEFMTDKDYNYGTVDMDYTFNANDVIDRLSGETKDTVVYEIMFKGYLSETEEGKAAATKKDSATTESTTDEAKADESTKSDDKTAETKPHTKIPVVAVEMDQENKDQTVTIKPSTIGTTATDKTDGDHELYASKEATIVDSVAYEGLIPGKEYTLKATLMDKSSGKALKVNDKEVTNTLKFTPNSQSGTVDIELTFDASALSEGTELVVFEELYKQVTIDGKTSDTLVAEHKDLEDEGQTVKITTTPPADVPPTGQDTATLKTAQVVGAAIAALLMIAAAGTIAYKKLRKSGAEE